MKLGFRSTDDRGARIFVPTGRFRLQRVRDSRQAEGLRHRRAGLKLRASADSLWHSILIGLVLFSFAGLSVWGAWRIAAMDLGSGWGLLLSVLAVFFVTATFWGPAEIRRMAEAHLKRARALPPVCPCCWYELDGLPASNDARTICPECGSAWLLGQPAGEVAGSTDDALPRPVVGGNKHDAVADDMQQQADPTRID